MNIHTHLDNACMHKNLVHLSILIRRYRISEYLNIYIFHESSNGKFKHITHVVFPVSFEGGAAAVNQWRRFCAAGTPAPTTSFVGQ